MYVMVLTQRKLKSNGQNLEVLDPILGDNNGKKRRRNYKRCKILPIK